MSFVQKILLRKKCIKALRKSQTEKMETPVDGPSRRGYQESWYCEMHAGNRMEIFYLSEKINNWLLSQLKLVSKLLYIFKQSFLWLALYKYIDKFIFLISKELALWIGTTTYVWFCLLYSSFQALRSWVCCIRFVLTVCYGYRLRFSGI